MKKLLLITGLSFILAISCSVEDNEKCDINNPCPTGFVCNLITGYCEKEAIVTDDEMPDNALPVDNEPDDEIGRAHV